jgi:hypothetical protein
MPHVVDDKIAFLRIIRDESALWPLWKFICKLDTQKNHETYVSH